MWYKMNPDVVQNEKKMANTSWKELPSSYLDHRKMINAAKAYAEEKL